MSAGRSPGTAGDALLRELAAWSPAEVDAFVRWGQCAWFARCTRPAVGVVAHPVLRDVPTCASCAQRHGLDLRSDA